MDNTSKLRLSGPGSLVAAVPHLLGFPPEESLVLVGLRGPASRLGMTMRLDLPPDGLHCAPAIDEFHPLGEALRGDDASDCLAMIITEQDDQDGVAPYVDLVSNLDQALYECGIEVSDIVLVRAGRWRSYLCPDPSCCPAQGTPIPAASGELAAYAAYSGSVVRSSRADLGALIAVDPTAVRSTERALDHVCREMAEAAESGTSEAYLARVADLIHRRVTALAAGSARPLSHRDAARMSIGLIDRQVRDRVAGYCLEESAAAAESLWVDLLRRLPTPLDAAPATMLAMSSWARGDGAMANVALDRALDSDPSYSLAQLVRTALDHALPPSTVRQMLTDPCAEAG
ncbi:MAG: DUF4192 domain-containing protein [Actinomycetota bacterium]|nr:DUF4192 domain-containing protein [Actinomycetota bacterium]